MTLDRRRFKWYHYFVTAIIGIVIGLFTVRYYWYKGTREKESLERERAQDIAEAKPTLDITPGDLSPEPLTEEKPGEFYLDGIFAVSNPTRWSARNATINVWFFTGRDWIGLIDEWAPPCLRPVKQKAPPWFEPATKGEGYATKERVTRAHDDWTIARGCSACLPKPTHDFEPLGANNFTQWVSPSLTANPRKDICKDKLPSAMVIKFSWRSETGSGGSVCRYIHVFCAPSEKAFPAPNEFHWERVDQLPKHLKLPPDLVCPSQS